MIDVYLPIEGTVAFEHIDSGSGIVGAAARGKDAEGLVTLYFEGNRYGFANVITFADRVRVAADRQRVRYPTIAQMTVKVEQVRKIGTYAAGVVTIDDVDDELALAEWLGLGRLPSGELLCTGASR